MSHNASQQPQQHEGLSVVVMDADLSHSRGDDTDEAVGEDGLLVEVDAGGEHDADASYPSAHVATTKTKLKRPTPQHKLRQFSCNNT